MADEMPPGGVSAARDELLRQAETLREAARLAKRAAREELLRQAEVLRQVANDAAWSTVDEVLQQAESALWTARRRPSQGREAAKQRTRDEILRAAHEVFARKGFHGASVDDVAAAAGFTKGAVYSNFASKDELFLALLDDRWSREAELWRRTFSEAPSPVAAWEALSRYHLEDALDQAEEAGWDLLSVEFYLYAMRVPAAGERVRARLRELRESVADLLEEHYRRAGVAPPMPILDLVVGLLAIRTGTGFQLVLDPEAVADPDRFSAALAGRLLGLDPAAEPEPDRDRARTRERARERARGQGRGDRDRDRGARESAGPGA